MLVLSRKNGEQIIITLEDGRTIHIAIVDIRDRSGHVRVGVQADKTIQIDRSERMNREMEAATQ